MPGCSSDGARERAPSNLRASGAARAPALVFLTVVLCLAGGAWLVMSRDGAEIQAADASEEKADENPIMELAPADVATVSLAMLNRGLPITGSLSPLLHTTVKAQVAGEVLEVTVREGQTVKKGDVLVRIDTRNLKAQLEAAQAALEKAKADLSLARINLDNNAVMLEKKFISQNTFDTVESSYQVALANVKAAEAELSLARIALQYATVTAPFDGTISGRMVNPGGKVEIGSDLMALVDLTHLELQAPAPSHEVPSVRIGQIARFRVDGFGERVFEGHVERINPMTDTGSRSIMLYLSVDNPDGVLKGGMFAQGSLILDESGPVPAVPLTALHDDAGSPYVFAIEDGRTVRRRVELGLRSPEQNLVEIRSGLKAGDRVVAVHLPKLVHGTRVSIPPAAGVAGDGGNGGGFAGAGPG
jgi:RND family efflux transporter MFP subunit